MSDEIVPMVDPGSVGAQTPVLDVRAHPGKKQIRGAVRYDPKALLGEEHLVLPLGRERAIVVYGDDESQAGRIAEHLRSQGYDALVLRGGFNAHRDAGLPTEDSTQEQPIPGNQDTGPSDPSAARSGFPY